MTWFATGLSQDQADLVSLVDAVVAKHGEVLGDDASTAARARVAMAEAGLWTIGISEDRGGGGAPMPLRLTAMVALGQRWAAWAWACAQVHAAAELLDGHDGAKLWSHIHAADPFVVVDAAAPHVEVEIDHERIRGSLRRVDPAGDNPHVVVLVDDSTAWLLPPEALDNIRSLRRTGMAGALSISAEIDASAADAVILTDVPVDEVRARLQLAGAAIAAGIALEAAERSVAYAGARVQFGAPLTELPTVRGALFDQARHATDALTLALGTAATPWRAAAVLAGNCERAIEAATSAVQAHGGYGYLAEYEVERLLRDAVSLRAATAAAHGARSSAANLVGHPGDPTDHVRKS